MTALWSIQVISGPYTTSHLIDLEDAWYEYDLSNGRFEKMQPLVWVQLNNCNRPAVGGNCFTHGRCLRLGRDGQ